MSKTSDIKSTTGSNCDIHKHRAVEIISICQIVAIFAVIIACIINLSLNDEKSVLWSSLLSGSLGYLLPTPKVRKNVRILSDPSIEQQYGILPGQHSNTLCDQITSTDFFDGGLGSSASGDKSTPVLVHST